VQEGDTTFLANQPEYQHWRAAVLANEASSN
jgi:hypothetical protein